MNILQWLHGIAITPVDVAQLRYFISSAAVSELHRPTELSVSDFACQRPACLHCLCFTLNVHCTQAQWEDTHTSTVLTPQRCCSCKICCFFVFCRHSYPSPCPPHSSLSPLRAVNKLGLSRPSRGPPSLHHHCTPPSNSPAHSAAALYAAERRQGDAQMIHWAILNHIVHTALGRED